jgi:hypothetical protein
LQAEELKQMMILNDMTPNDTAMSPMSLNVDDTTVINVVSVADQTTRSNDQSKVSYVKTSKTMLHELAHVRTRSHVYVYAKRHIKWLGNVKCPIFSI